MIARPVVKIAALACSLGLVSCYLMSGPRSSHLSGSKSGRIALPSAQPPAADSAVEVAPPAATQPEPVFFGGSKSAPVFDDPGTIIERGGATQPAAQYPEESPAAPRP